MKQNYPPFEESLLLSYLLGRSGEEDQRAIGEWLDQDETHRRYLDQLEQVWVESERISPAPLAVDVDAAWERMLGRIGQEDTKTPVRSLRYVWTAAAVLLVSFGIYFAVRLFVIPPRMIEQMATTTVVKETLPDGSTVSLNRNSRITYPEKFTRGRREVKLDGEAYFDVKHQDGHSFVVEAGRAQIRVLGTSFRVKAFSGADVEVEVEKGRVMLFTVDPEAGDTLSVVLAAGEQGVLPAGSQQPVLRVNDQPDRLSWLDRTLEFRQTELSQVFTVLSEHFGITIRAGNPDILRCRLSATFRDESLQTILEVIAGSFGLELKQEGTQWIFNGKGCDQ